MNQQKSLLLFGGRICQELSRQPFLSKDYQGTYIDSLLNTQHYPDAVLPKEIGTDIRPDLLVIDFQAVIEEWTGLLSGQNSLLPTFFHILRLNRSYYYMFFAHNIMSSKTVFV